MKYVFYSFLVVFAVAVAAGGDTHGKQDGNADLSAEQLVKVQQIYAKTCLKCHTGGSRRVDPKSFKDTEKMQRTINGHGVRAGKLSAEDAKLLTDYFIAVRLDKAELPKITVPVKKEKKGK